MPTRRIHVMGASGAGTTTLGRALADALAAPSHDTDDYFWVPTTPPFQTRRSVADRLRLMHEMFAGRSEWVLSGCVGDWGDPLIPLFDLVVFLYVPTDIRLARLRSREALRGPVDDEFIEWATHYDDGTREGRNLMQHEARLSRLRCPVLRLDGTLPVADLVATVLGRLP